VLGLRSSQVSRAVSTINTTAADVAASSEGAGREEPTATTTLISAYGLASKGPDDP
jgi:hypothetical protein